MGLMEAAVTTRTTAIRNTASWHTRRNMGYSACVRARVCDFEPCGRRLGSQLVEVDGGHAFELDKLAGGVDPRVFLVAERPLDQPFAGAELRCER